MPNKPSGRPSRFLVGVEPVIRAALLGAGGKSRRVAPTARRGANDAPTAEPRQGASLPVSPRGHEREECKWPNPNQCQSIPGTAFLRISTLNAEPTRTTRTTD